jgi:hypothetical protein
MPRPCSICTDPGVEDVNSRLRAGDSLREVARTFGVARATLTRHASHIEAGHPSEGDPPVGPQLTAALRLVEEVRTRRGVDYTAQDHAEAVHLRLLAGAVDASPSVASIRELRLTLAEFRRATEPVDEDERFAFATLIASVSPKPMGASNGA